MGIIRKTLYTGVLTAGGVIGYLGATTRIIAPLPRDDPIFSSKVFKKYNRHRNPSTQDICEKRIPLDQVRSELLQKDGDLVLEFCRGVWSGLGFRAQQRMAYRDHYKPELQNQLWTPDQLATANYDPGTIITDHFEVVEKTPTQIVVRCGDSPTQRAGPRESDGLFAISARVDKERKEVVLQLKSCFFNSATRVEGILGPMPQHVELLHRWYARLWMATGARRVVR